MGIRKPRLSELCTNAVTIWFDPGVTTGWSVMSVHPEALVNPDYKILSNIEHWTHGQIDCGHRRGLSDVRDIFDGEGRLEYSELAVNLAGECEGVAEMLQIVDDWPGASVGLEDFILRMKSMDRELLSPVRMTAAFDFGMYTRGFQTFRQQPSEAKGLATDDRLKSWGFYERSGGMNHARDADRHCITWLRKMKAKKLLREAAWPHLYGKMQVFDKITKEFVTAFGPYYIPAGKTWQWVVDQEEMARKMEERDNQIAAEIAMRERAMGGELTPKLMVSASVKDMIAEIQEYEFAGADAGSEEAAGQGPA